jgi:HSP20 family molecular chaperone IbpA
MPRNIPRSWQGLDAADDNGPDDPPVELGEREGLLGRRTRRIGIFEYRLTLLGDFSADDVEASLAHGVLTVQVPKAQTTKQTKVEVSESSSK